MACGTRLLSVRHRRAAAAMLDELLGARLVVDLVPSRRHEIAARGGKIRVVLERNADWYRRLCKRYPSNARMRRLIDTRIKRQDTIDALQQLIDTRCVTSTYQQRIAACIPGFLSDRLADVPF